MKGPVIPGGRGGTQRIPRPVGWQLGAPAPWRGSERAIDLDELLAVITARGPGSAPTFELANAKVSAVLIALFDQGSGPEVVLTKRTEELRNHKGEISFPGGRLDAGESPVEAALREASEEIGLDSHLVTVMGELDHLATVVSNSRIVPIVARLADRPVMTPNPREVDYAFTVLLSDLLHPEAFREERWSDMETARAIHFYELPGETVWGATGRMLTQLLSIATGVAS